MPTTDDPRALRALAAEVACEAGQLLARSRPTVTAAKSSPTDLVTDADHAAEALIVERLRAERPDDGVLAEEGSLHKGTTGLNWVIDPLDGTVNYVYGYPHWAVSIGLEGALHLGAVYDPSRDELFTDADALVPSTQSDLAHALIGTGFSYSAAVRARQGAVLARVIPAVRDIRRGGSLALDLAWVACGRLDAMYEHDTHPWDVSAGIAMLEAAGGAVAMYGSTIVAAGNEALLRRLEALILDADPGPA